MTAIIRDVMELEYKRYKYLGNGSIAIKKAGKTRVVSFNEVYNTLIDYGVDFSSSKVKDTLNIIHDYKEEK